MRFEIVFVKHDLRWGEGGEGLECAVLHGEREGESEGNLDMA